MDPHEKRVHGPESALVTTTLMSATLWNSDALLFCKSQKRGLHVEGTLTKYLISHDLLAFTAPFHHQGPRDEATATSRQAKEHSGSRPATVRVVFTMHLWFTVSYQLRPTLPRSPTTHQSAGPSSLRPMEGAAQGGWGVTVNPAAHNHPSASSALGPKT